MPARAMVDSAPLPEPEAEVVLDEPEADAEPVAEWLELDEEEDELVAKRWTVDDDHSLTKESAKRLQEMYQDELLLRFRGHTAGLLNRDISWHEFEKYADTKEAGTFVLALSCGGFCC